MLCIQVNAQRCPLEKLRPSYMKALHDYAYAPAVYDQFLKVENPSAKLLAYRGALEAIMTKTTWNFFKKIGYLNKCKASFEEAIEKDPKNIEVRFLRLSVEHEIPSYLGYSEHLEEDQKFVVENILLFDPLKMEASILEEILLFVRNSGRFSQEEVLLFERLFASN